MTSIALVGPTGIGKTRNLVELLPNNLLVRHLEDLKGLKSYHKHIIFDDISFNYFSRPEAVIHILDNEYHATVRVLRDTVRINPNIRRWFTHNNPDFIYPILSTSEQKEAIDRRIKIFQVTKREEIIKIINGRNTTTN